MAKRLAIEIFGADELQEMLKTKSSEIKQKAEEAVIQGALFLNNEVKQSIAGKRAEPRSVDTGRFLNSVAVERKGILETSVYTDVEYAPELEYGTSTRRARRHFKNSAERNREKIVSFVKERIGGVF